MLRNWIRRWLGMPEPTPPIVVHKVEIVVSSNQPAGAVARRVADEIAKLRRHPRVCGAA